MAAHPDLIVRRHVRANPQTVFDTWTDPEQLIRWWGPKDVQCTHAEVDLQVGGTFRLANRAPDGTTVWIAGMYEVIDRPRLLRHTWFMEDDESAQPERVTVEFLATESGTEIVITHAAIATARMWHGHQDGWFGCLDGLVELLAGHPA